MLDWMSPALIVLVSILLVLVLPVLVMLRVTRRLAGRRRVLRFILVPLPSLLWLAGLWTFGLQPQQVKTGAVSVETPAPPSGPKPAGEVREGQLKEEATAKADLPTPTPPPSPIQAPPPSPSKMPDFPWPPPRPSAEVVLPRTVFATAATLGQVSLLLDQAMMKTGYAERSFYSVPGGVSIVSRMERTDRDGRPVGGSNRWLQQEPYLQSLSLSAYIRALFTAREGYYRLVVFTVTNVPFSSADGSITPAQANSLLANGFNTLPESVAAQPLPGNAVCTGLIYEFLKEQGKDPALLLPGHLDAKTHLVASGLWSALRLNP